jgi:predicted metal-dependent hydrolase
MSPGDTDYDPRYLAGIVYFNERDFFEAHEVWEDLWAEAAGPERRFYQGLIQAAVGLHHFSNGNLRGAVKLYHSSRNYMEPFGSPYLGLNTGRFWTEMERCFRDVLASENAQRDLRPAEELMPTIALDPPPRAWPEPEDDEHESQQSA